MIVMETTNKQMNKQSSDISDANNNKQTFTFSEPLVMGSAGSYWVTTSVEGHPAG